MAPCAGIRKALNRLRWACGLAASNRSVSSWSPWPRCARMAEVLADTLLGALWVGAVRGDGIYFTFSLKGRHILGFLAPLCSARVEYLAARPRWLWFRHEARWAESRSADEHPLVHPHTWAHHHPLAHHPSAHKYTS